MTVGPRGPETTEDIRLYFVAVTLADDGSDGILRLVSIFHRRQMDFLHATFTREPEFSWMVASVEAAESRIRTLTMSLANAVDVVSYDVWPITADETDAAASLPCRPGASMAREFA